jgi:hypothetical protein
VRTPRGKWLRIIVAIGEFGEPPTDARPETRETSASVLLPSADAAQLGKVLFKRMRAQKIEDALHDLLHAL